MKQNNDNLSGILTKATGEHCAAFFWGSYDNTFFRNNKCLDYAEDQGTMTFIEFKENYYGITNKHVIGDKLTKSHAKGTFWVALENHRPVPGELIFESTQNNIDFPYDIAVFHLAKNEIDKSKKIPFKLNDIEPYIEVGKENLLSVGFPGLLRSAYDSETQIHPMYHVVSTCHSFTDRMIYLESDLPEDKRNVKFGGMSGGPIFKIGDNDSTYYELVGIVFEGKGFADALEEDKNKTIQDRINILGCPMTYKKFQIILSCSSES
ncbi:MAG: serine protease [Desulfobacteraceae bacterium]|nr:serine protease [Desulfobacteraceae bacterium]